ncbi:MAG: ABC transporter ATP-binding protein [Gammaproteobacteria bacterium]|jgi:iron(III) transport system ATP-binding protein|nr:ABC transporter ATP-binding protein [Gammaproteobacteria bacterium]
MTEQQTALLEVTNLTVDYDSTRALTSLDLSLQQGQLLCLLGPSGCGKSTLLRAIAGFQDVAAGRIVLAGQLLSGAGINLAPEHRQIGMVFQDIALFPHLTVRANIAFGLHQWSADDAQRRVEYLLSMVGLAGFGERYPHELSGGQQQRVALARAIAPKCNLLLLDEPFSGLDAALREALVPEVAALLKREGITAILVSHDQKEAFAFADQIAVMHHGEIEQLSSAYEIYHKPASRFVADFVGEGDFIAGQVVDSHQITCILGNISNGKLDFETGCKVDVFVRPDDILHDDGSPIKGHIVSKRFRGTHFLYRIELASGEQVACFTDSHHDHDIGEDIGIKLNMEHLLAFRS